MLHLSSEEVYNVESLDELLWRDLFVEDSEQRGVIDLDFTVHQTCWWQLELDCVWPLEVLEVP